MDASQRRIVKRQIARLRFLADQALLRDADETARVYETEIIALRQQLMRADRQVEAAGVG
jgi:hypothetical protein